MEYSSPLAAMRPQPCPTWIRDSDMHASHNMFPSFQPLPSRFDFRNMSMNQQRPTTSRDYFSARPVRGSSPTSSLTADLDANFHIDKSPQFVTPRRALFTANVIKPTNVPVRVSTPPTDEARTLTPMVPSSSPGIDMVDVSPLPHKAPFFVSQITLPSPTPEETPQEPIPSSELEPSPDSAASELSGFLQLPERRRPVTRPSLSRAKGWSTSSVVQRTSSATITTTTTELPPFRFGNVAANALTSTSTLSLADAFTASPVEMPLALSNTFSHSRRPSLSAAARSSGSPCSGHVRKSSNSRPPFSRPPRKQMRRSLSMFQHPDEVMKEEQEVFGTQSPLMSMIEVDAEHTMKLPHFIPDGEPDSLPRITQDTMVDILDRRYTNDFSNVLVIDCRFEYEYEGGHIENAINYNDKQLLAEKLFAEPPPPSNTLIIFHCEYSVHRAPLTAKFIRNHDRNINAINYPNLTYPEMYILDGGYSRFFATHRSKCQPQNYVEMSDLRHEQACERGMARVKQRQKLFRNQTFAFGQSGDADCMEDSPTQNPARSGLCQRSQSTFDVGPDIAAGIGEKFQRRMASY